MGSGCRFFGIQKKAVRQKDHHELVEAFFHFTDLNQCCNSGLTLCQFFELVFMFVFKLPTQMVMDRTGRSNECVSDWFNICREICTAVMKTKGKIVGNVQNPIEIDEAVSLAEGSIIRVDY